MVLGNINGVSLETILSRIPDTNLRTAYQASLERFSREHPSAMSNAENLARYLNPRVFTHHEGIGYENLREQVARGLLHADEYVAAAYVLRSLAYASQVSNGLFRFNPLRAEHLIYLDEQTQFLRAGADCNNNQTALLTAYRDIQGLEEGIESFLGHFHAMPVEQRSAWAALDVYADSGVQTDFMALRTRLGFAERFYEGRLAPLNLSLDPEDRKPEIPLSVPSNPPESLEPPCAPHDPSCQD